MKNSKKRGLGFGITSGVITTLGLMVGLYEATNSRLAILGGIITIAVADAFSDSFGMHLSEEAAGKSTKAVWESTFSTFIFKFLTAIIFIIPLLILELKEAVITNVSFGLLILAGFTFKIAKKNKIKAILEHLSISIFVILITLFVGKGINLLF